MGHIHSNNHYDFTVSALIVHKQKVLLLFHRKLNLWLPPAGHIELDENPIEALYRETHEETGLTKEHLTLLSPYTDNMNIEYDTDFYQVLAVPFNITAYTANPEGHRHVDFAYVFVSDTDKVESEGNGAERLEWFRLDEIATLAPTHKLTLGNAKYALKLAEKFG